MIDPNEIADAVVDMLRDMPDVVEAMGDDLGNIRAYHGQWPTENNSFLAVSQTKPPTILVVPRGFYEGERGIPRNKYPLSIYIRPRDGESGHSVAKLILGGIPNSGGGVKFRFLTIHPQCLPMTDTPRFQQLVVPVGDNSIEEIPELQLILTENGDN